MGSNNRKYTIEEVRENLRFKGFELLSDEYVNNKSKVKVKDVDGYVALVKYEALIHNGSFKKFHKSNPYSIYNIIHCIKESHGNQVELLSKEFMSTTAKLKWRCKCGNIFERNFQNIVFQKTYRCIPCFDKTRGAIRKLSKNYILKLAKNKNLELCDEYINSTTKMKLKDKDGYYYSLTLGSLKYDAESLIKFGETNDYSIENIKHWIKENNLPFELVSNKVWGYRKPLTFKCLKENCGEMFNKYIPDLISNRYGCAFCAGQKVGVSNCLATKYPEIAEEWNFNMNGDLTASDVTCGSGLKVWWDCKKCNHEWEATIGSRTNLKSGCPNCCSSKMEGLIYNILTKHHIKFKTQYKFDDCRNIFPLPFDFYLEDYNTTIEAQGEGHYQPIKFFGGEERFEKQQIRDQIKRDYCKDNNIKLIEIPYWDFDNIEEILVKELNLELNNT